MLVILKDHTKLSNAVDGARVCYNSFDKGGYYKDPTDNISESDAKLLERLLHKFGHYSVSRHVKYNFAVEGISTKTLLALSRHQIGIDLSVMSSRFCKIGRFGSNYTKTPNVEVNKLIEQHIKEIEELSEMCKVSAEDLAMLYPQAMQYDLRMTMNPQSLQHLLDVRLTKEAHYDIRELARLLLEAVPDTHKFLYKVD